MEYDFQKTYRLRQWSPLIHFQSEQSGATLRGTEVKPKFDRFIFWKYEKRGIQIPDKWKINGRKTALNYKLSINCSDVDIIRIGSGEYGIYYANMGIRDENEKIKGVWSDSVYVTITCFIPELMETIDNMAEEFFIVTNFGAMQDKGFGSFTLGEEVPSGGKVSICLREVSGANKCYSFVCEETMKHHNNEFRAIKTIYSLMKSGINHGSSKYARSLLFRFMHERFCISNEKAYLKHIGMAPAVGEAYHQRPIESYTYDDTGFYVRALLGVADHLYFQNMPLTGCEKEELRAIKMDLEELANNKNKNSEEKERDLKSRERNLKRRNKDKTIIDISGERIKRLSSPIFFKVIGNNVYFVGFRINDDIYSEKFTFTPERSSENNSFIPARPVVLEVPSKEILGEGFIDDFLEYAVDLIEREEKSKFKKELGEDFQIKEV